MPKGLPWFRLYAEFAFDPKMQTISETLQRRYIMLLCLKCHGDLPGLNDIQLSGALRISIDELQETHKSLLSIGVITENYDIPKWSERQYLSDYSSLRVKRFRDKKSETLQKRKCNAHVTKMKRPLSVSVSVSDSVSKSFLIPTLEELKSYIQEKKYNVSAEKFLAYYESNGWMVGKNKMKKWQSALVTWHHGNYGNGSNKKQSTSWGGIAPNVTDHRTKEQEISDLKYSIGCLEELKLDKTVHENNFVQLPRLKERLADLEAK